MALIALCVTLLVLFHFIPFLYLGASDSMLNGTRYVAVSFLHLLHMYLIYSCVNISPLLLFCSNKLVGNEVCHNAFIK